MLVSNSAGNHRFHSYNGSWRRGRMHGAGTYRFADDTEYVGNWVDGKREGDVDDEHDLYHEFGAGVTSYKDDVDEMDDMDGSTYKGGWKAGLFHGYQNPRKKKTTPSP